MKILSIESSCDETAVAVVENGSCILSNVVYSQIDIHKQYGGVVPEVAARSHIEAIIPAVDEALIQSGCSWEEIDAIAVTNAPGLSGSLLIGTLTARTLAKLKNKPLYPIHHVEAHVYANFLTDQKNGNLTLPAKQPEFPMLALIVSGGHSQLVLFKNHGDYILLGQTQDDAVGEAFDKVAKIIGLPYPGGPSISKLAPTGNENAYGFPIAKVKGEYNFSFSGLKTAVLRKAQEIIGKDHTFASHQIAKHLSKKQQADIAASFQKTAIKTLLKKTVLAYQNYMPKSVVIAGGVAANQLLRSELKKSIEINIEYAPISLCTDNAAMVGALAYFYSKEMPPVNPDDVEIFPSISMTKTAWNKKHTD